MLRRSESTVTEMAAEIGLTDNAVRSHLAALERDGLVEQRGVRRQVGKPAYIYGITADGEALFPKAYATVLGELVRALEDRLGSADAGELLREVGRRLGRGWGGQVGGRAEEAVTAAVRVLEDLSGPVEVESANGSGAIVRGSGCPLGGVVADHPEVCRLVESLLSEVTGGVVTECCDRRGLPQCAFRVG
jgi:predicted ArsR family transcriptional regulator